MLIMLFQTSHSVANGNSIQRSRCHQLYRYTVPASLKSAGTARSEW